MKYTYEIQISNQVYFFTPILENLNIISFLKNLNSSYGICYLLDSAKAIACFEFL